MKSVDVAVIGGGILGCFAARNLMRWNLSVVLIEKELDICTGITRANSAIVYAGYDNKTGSLKAELTVRGNASFDDLCRELEVPFSRCGSLLVTYDKESLAQLRRKWEQGISNGVPGLELLTGGEAEAMEPMLAPGVAGALYAPTTGTVNPWQLGIAAFENAAANGMEPMLGTTVMGIRKTKFGYLVETDRSELRCRAHQLCRTFRGSDTGAVLSLRHASSDRWSRIPGPGQTGAEAEAGHLSAGTVLRKRHHRYPVCGRESAAQRGTQARWRTFCHNKRGNIGVEDKCGIAVSESEYAAGNPLIRRRTAKSSAG